MKKIYFIAILISGFYAVNAQPEPGYNKELMMSEKIAYFSKMIEFTPDEAKLFWPQYDEYAEKREAMMKERRTIMHTCRHGIDQLTETQIKTYSDKLTELDQKDLQLKEKYLVEFKKILSPAKLLKFQLAEEHFRVHLLRQLKGHGKGMGKGPGFENREME